jgi:tetratricopeptide (TPR) repeat protein
MAADGSNRQTQIEDLGTTIACIMGAARDDQMPLKGEALRHWAAFCDGDDGLDPSPGALLARLEALVRAEPRSALGWEALANQRLENVSSSDPRWREKALLPARAAVERAVALAPDRQGLLRSQASVTEPDAFAERERLLLKAGADKGDGYVQQALGHHFRAVGRIADARKASELSVELQPWNTLNRQLLYMTQRLEGEFGAAAETLARLPDAEARATGAVGIAIYKADWREARRLAPEGPDSPYGRALIELLDALVAGDAGALRAAGDGMAALARDPATNNASVARMLAIAGRPEAALHSIDRAIGPANYAGPMMELYAPAFAPVRATPGFWALAERRGLVSYWRETGTLPDFCRQGSAPAPCAALQPRRG